ncbi:hypothetical protein GCM10009555_019780 [Acrocarpospora macrocephala]|uniref:JAB-N domain-containing protein n=1 Tax=Acrocarpospora macrocephala TaxID=150177 RepID=A0A5M3WIP6_9ACTN|nr:JAB N-terminal domain-containing protein [Acrocarpospora macrocephala]GES08022.1 hypothetical protein Amac_016170 [Acrocarpospora macrocephala]
MSYEVELFRGGDQTPVRRVPLEPVLRRFFESQLDQALSGAVIQLLFLPEPEPGPAVSLENTGGFSVANLRPRYGHVQVRVLLNDELLYQHPHPVSELLGRALRDTLRELAPDERHWGFGLHGPNFDHGPLVRPVPEMEHGVHIEVGAHRGRIFDLEELPPPDPPLSTLAELGADATPSPGKPIAVVLGKSMYAAFTETHPFSTEVEEGGFLAGRVYRDAAAPGRHLIELTAMIPAQRTGASMLSFTFTGESFLSVGELLAVRRQGEELVGWYHTHLFAAGRGLGLSSVDVRLHRSTFQRPWQVAALVNISRGARVLRFYCRDDARGMMLAPYWTVP